MMRKWNRVKCASRLWVTKCVKLHVCVYLYVWCVSVLCRRRTGWRLWEKDTPEPAGADSEQLHLSHSFHKSDKQHGRKNCVEMCNENIWTTQKNKLKALAGWSSCTQPLWFTVRHRSIHHPAACNTQQNTACVIIHSWKQSPEEASLNNCQNLLN